MVYRYTTPLGTFAIRPHRSDAYRVELWIEEQKKSFRSYSSPRHAAADVAAHSTGFDQWDTSAVQVPENLEEWASSQT